MKFMRKSLLATFALCLSALAFAQDMTAEAKDEVLKGLDKVIAERVFVPGVDLKKWPEFATKHREAIDKATTIDDFSREVNRALREFGFSHIRLRTPRSAQSRGRTFVVGPGFNARYENETLVVVSVTKDSPAETVGLKAGDVIVEVDGKAPTSASSLSGDENTELTIKVKREGEEPKELKVQRKRISTVRPETLTMVGDDAAVLRVYTFSTGYDRKNLEKLIGEATTKAKFLVLDLRSNGGGAVNNLQHLLSLLLPPDTAVGTFISKNTFQRYLDETKKDGSNLAEVAAWSERKYKTSKREVPHFPGKIAVLTNRASASASEICAAALRENLKAPIVGQQTAGAVLASVYARLPQGFELQHPTSDYVTIKGMRLEGNPLKPDAEVTGRPADGKDPVVDKALEMLRQLIDK